MLKYVYIYIVCGLEGPYSEKLWKQQQQQQTKQREQTKKKKTVTEHFQVRGQVLHWTDPKPLISS